MGYTYDVALLVANASRKVIEKELLKSTEEIRSFFTDLCDSIFTDSESGDVLYIWTFNKLSSGKEEFLDELVELIPDENLRFIKLGENWNDIEILGLHFNKNFGLDLVRDIRFRKPSDETNLNSLKTDNKE
jgi:hypothetical protein